jgi:hypothetical protein
MAKSGKMTLEKFAVIMAENFEYFRKELKDDLAEVRVEFRSEIQQLRDHMDAKFLAVHNRLDDLSLNRATRDELAATNARVTRIEGHLGLA